MTPLPSTRDDRRWRHAAWWLIGLLLAFRLAYAATAPLDLVHDEAYYWDWSRQLDWGYYSKPPLVAWTIAASTRPLGSTPFTVRLPAVLLGTLGLLLVYALAARLYGRQAGFVAVALSAATPGNTVMSLLMTIDAPFVFCWCAALYSFWRMLERGPDRLRWLVLTTLAIGVGLLAKQTMLGFLALGGLFVVASPDDRRELLRPGLWLCAAAALLFLTPVLWWNSHHGWITLAHTSEHFAAESIAWTERLFDGLEYLGSQAGVAAPVTWALLSLVGIALLVSWRRLERRERYLLCFSLVPLLGVAGLAFKQRVEPNWPAAFYPAAVILTAGWATGAVTTAWIWLERRRRSWTFAAIATGAACAALTYAAPWAVGPLGLVGGKLDPTVRLRGWRELAEATEQVRRTLPDADRRLVISAAGRATASELAFYLPDQPTVHLWTYGPGIGSQYELWGGPRDAHGASALIVAPPGDSPPAVLADAFTRVEPAGDVAVAIGNGRFHRFRLWRGEQMSHWPVYGRAVENIAREPAESSRRQR